MDTVVFEAPVLAHKQRLIGQDWQLRYCKLRRNGQLHVSSSDRSGQLSFTMDLKLLPTSMIRAGRNAIREALGRMGSCGPFPHDEFVEPQHDIVVRIDWSVVLMDVRHKGRFYPLAFTNAKHFVRFLKQLKQMHVYQAHFDDLILKAVATGSSGTSAGAGAGTGGHLLLNRDALQAWLHIAWRTSTKCIRSQEQHSEQKQQHAGDADDDGETEALAKPPNDTSSIGGSSSYARTAQLLAAQRQPKK